MEQARQGELLEEQVNDATSKLGLLNGEVAFNKSLGATLEGVQAIQRTLDIVQRAILAGRLLEAVDLLEQVIGELESMLVPRSTRVAGILAAKVDDLRNDVVEKLTDCWKAYICVDPARSSIKISRSLKGRSPPFTLLTPGLLLSRLFYRGHSNVGSCNDKAATIRHRTASVLQRLGNACSITSSAGGSQRYSWLLGD